MDQQGSFLLLAVEGGLVERRNVVPGAQKDGLTVIQKGLSKGDQVITRGIQRARPGGKVVPEAIQQN